MMMNASWQEIGYLFSPLWVLCAGALLVMTISAFVKGEREIHVYRLLAVASMLVAITLVLYHWHHNEAAFIGESLVISRFNLYLCFLILFSSLLVVLFAPNFIDFFNALKKAEFYSLVLFATVGMLMMNLSLNLLFIFLGLELASMSFYILIAMRQDNRAANEAAIKYFIYGSLASALFLYGIAFFYGATQSVHLRSLIHIALTTSQLAYLKFSFVLLFAGMSFKLALFPFYFWTPDVYQGAPTLLTGWMATSVKAAVFGVFLAMLGLFGGLSDSTWISSDTQIAVLGLVASATMLIGNLLALRQTSLKRLLACSSIAHAGYLLIALTTSVMPVKGATNAVSGLLFYLLVYTLMTLGAFFCISLLARHGDDDLQVAHLNGLGKRHPQLAFYLSVFMFSLAGIPPTAGFLGKYTIFIHASRQGLYGLVWIGVLASVIGLYYYLKVVAAMYFQEPLSAMEAVASPSEAKPRYYFGMLLIVFLVIATLALGVWPQNYLVWAWMSK